MRTAYRRGHFVTIVTLALACLIGTGPPAQADESLDFAVSANPLNNTSSISAGGDHTCIVTASGGVKCWGSAAGGALGDGSLASQDAPVGVVGLASGVAAVAVAAAHACALTTAGGVVCWGFNGSGQLGDGTTNTTSLTPVGVSGLASGVSAIAAAANRTCALTSAGGLKCWGSGYGPTPTDVVGLTSGVAGVAAGSLHTCALTAAGGVKCWGDNGSGQLGVPNIAWSATPVDVTGLTSGVAAITAGGGPHDGHTCALTVAGGVKCWGYNGYGQVGDGTNARRNYPVDVVGLTSGVASVSAGDTHTCAVTALGGVLCWGRNEGGQLGIGIAHTLAQPVPVEVSGLTSGIAAVSAGTTHTCVRTAGGEVNCWGNNEFGQLGDDLLSQSRVLPVDTNMPAASVSAISTGGANTCALTSIGAPQCWGRNAYGQLGDGTTISRFKAGGVSGLAGGVSVVRAGASHTCVLTAAGAIKCWGDNFFGQLGDGTKTANALPQQVSGPTSGFDAISAGSQHTCAITSSGGVKCWGFNEFGQLGDGTDLWRYSPVDVAGLAAGVSAIAAGGLHTCALMSTGGVKCWGLDDKGQLGNGVSMASYEPTDVVGLSSGVQAIAAGGGHSCALTAAGGVLCWGDNRSGQLGDGTWGETDGIRPAPVQVIGMGSGVSAIAAGGLHTCALMSTGNVKCWGNNESGQVGDGTNQSRNVPADATDLSGGVSAIASGGAHACALLSVGGIKCWGGNADGQLGVNNGWAPVGVVDGSSARHAISGRVRFVGGGALEGVVLSAGSMTGRTTDEGEYRLIGLAAGGYDVTPALGGYAFTPPSRPISISANIENLDFTAESLPASQIFISGRVTMRGVGLPGITLSTSGRTTTTDSQGGYSFDNIDSGSLTVTPSGGGYVFTPPSRLVVVPPSAGRIDFVVLAPGDFRVDLPFVAR